MIDVRRGRETLEKLQTGKEKAKSNDKMSLLY